MENLIPSGSPTGNLSRGRRLRGFTFVELMVVMTIMVIIISMAIPIYNRSIIRAKESVLANNLTTLAHYHRSLHLRQAKGARSEPLQDLVTEGYPPTKVPV